MLPPRGFRFAPRFLVLDARRRIVVSRLPRRHKDTKRRRAQGHKGTEAQEDESGVRDEIRETKILLEGERGFGYFGPREIAKRHLTG